MERGLIVRDGPSKVGAAWAQQLGASVSLEGRPIAGGWPGTLVEARALISRYLHDELTARGFSPLGKGELDAAASATYSRAKAEWLGLERTSKQLARRGLHPRD